MGGGRQEDDEGVDEGEMSLVGRVRPEADTRNFPPRFLTLSHLHAQLMESGSGLDELPF